MKARFAGPIFALLATPVVAQDAAPQQEACPPIRQFAALPMVRDADNLSWVPISVNGQAKYFMLHTGEAYSQLFLAAAKEMQLAPEAAGDIIDIYGNVSNKRVPVASLVLGRVTYTPNSFMMLSPLDNPNYEGNNRLQAGKLGFNMLAAYDLDIDFGKRVMNIFSADHCEDKLGFAVPPGTVSVPFELDGAGQVRVPVALDGVELSAVISTGLPLTTLNQSVATDTLKVDLSGSDVKKSKIGSVTVYQRSFKTLGLGGFRVNAPVVEILPDIKGRNINRPSQTSQVSITGLNEVTTYTQTDEGRSLRREYKLPDVSIGANVLNGLHLYVAAKEKKIYLMPAAGAAP